MEGIRDAFVKVKNDIDLLKKESDFNEGIVKENRSKIIEICNILENLEKKILMIEDNNQHILNILNSKDKLDTKEDTKLDIKTQIATDFFDFTLDSTDISTGNSGVETKTDNIKTDNENFKPLNGQILPISIGNGGVQTDKQTDKQTDTTEKKSSHNQEKKVNEDINNKSHHTDNSINSAMNILDSLDSLKKEIRLKFRRLTVQEMLVFSTIYQQEEEFGYSDYKQLSKKLSLTESSIRDYIRRLINKGIPIDKNKINNKEIRLSISTSLKKIASLGTILTLKDI